MNFAERQIFNIIDLVAEKEAEGSPVFTRWVKITGDIVFLVVMMILFYKGLLYLDTYIRSHFFGEAVSAPLRPGVIHVKGTGENIYEIIIRNGYFLTVALGSIFLALVNLLLMLRRYIKPFQVLTILGYFTIMKTVIELSFSSSSPNGFGELLEQLADQFF